jgi:hypothetical protein
MLAAIEHEIARQVEQLQGAAILNRRPAHDNLRELD